MIKEIIVVEGKDDEARVKEAVDAEVIATHGFGISAQTFERIKKASEGRGIIILTDPDFAGERIRERVAKLVPSAKHAYITRTQGEKNGDVGVENASPEAIRNALLHARCENFDKRSEFTMEDLLNAGLVGKDDSSKRREKLGKALSLGYSNSGRLLKMLNNFGIEREEFQRAVDLLDESDE